MFGRGYLRTVAIDRNTKIPVLARQRAFREVLVSKRLFTVPSRERLYSIMRKRNVKLEREEDHGK